MSIDFEGLSRALQDRIRELLPAWLPGGHVVGQEYMCSNLRGADGDPKGDSLRVNLTGKGWKDFATDQKGGDLTSLYAAIEGITNVEAAKRLDPQGHYQTESRTPAPAAITAPPAKTITPPPPGSAVPDMIHYNLKMRPTYFWPYVDAAGNVLQYIARYELPDGPKEFSPWSWWVEGKQFVQKKLPGPQPLLGLDELAARPDAPVMIVEGEKARDAAKKIWASYVVMTWPGGANAWQVCDWSPLKGRKTLLWPDSDRKRLKAKDPRIAALGLKEGDLLPFEEQPGLKAAIGIAKNHLRQASEVKVICVPTDETKKDGWDAADALAEGWTWETVAAWAKPLLKVFPVEQSQEVLPPAPPVDPPKEPEDREEQEEDFSSPAHLHAAWNDMGIGLTGGGNPICNFDNALRIIERWKDLKDLVWFDEFHQKYFTAWGTKGKGHREWTDVDDLRLLGFMQRELGMARMSKEMVCMAVITYARARTKNEPKDWLETLTWDGEGRIDEFFIYCMGVKRSDYSLAASKNWWISMAARIYEPGVKMDTMVVLEGEQGSFKSTALNVIGGEWYTETHESPLSKDFYMVIQGKLVIEISELHSFSGPDISAIKKCVTTKKDRFRPPYGRAVADFPRQCVFVGTTNEDTYLRDHTGARRFWPIKTTHINLAMIAKHRDQLFAEAVHRHKAGEKFHEMPLSALAEQEHRRQSDSWEEAVLEFSRGREEDGVTILDVAVDCLSFHVSKITRGDQLRIGQVLRQIGWRPVVSRDQGTSVKRFYPIK